MQKHGVKRDCINTRGYPLLAVVLIGLLLSARGSTDSESEGAGGPTAETTTAAADGGANTEVPEPVGTTPAQESIELQDAPTQAHLRSPYETATIC